ALLQDGYDEAADGYDALILRLESFTLESTAGEVQPSLGTLAETVDSLVGADLAVLVAEDRDVRPLEASDFGTAQASAQGNPDQCFERQTADGPDQTDQVEF